MECCLFGHHRLLPRLQPLQTLFCFLEGRVQRLLFQGQLFDVLGQCSVGLQGPLGRCFVLLDLQQQGVAFLLFVAATGGQRGECCLGQVVLRKHFFVGVHLPLCLVDLSLLLCLFLLLLLQQLFQFLIQRRFFVARRQLVLVQFVL